MHKITNYLIAVAFILTLSIGVLIGYNLKTENNKPIAGLPIPNATTCNYNGKKYNEGDGFKSTDGCNTCSCSGGQIACTLMACQ